MAPDLLDERSPAPPIAPGWTRPDVVALLGWAALVALALAWGTGYRDPDVGLRAAPFVGRFDLHLTAGLVAAVAVAAVVVARPPATARAAGVAAAAWAAALAGADGWDRITAPLTTRHEYEPFAARITDLGPFLRTYADSWREFPVHVQGHPPGATVLAWVLDRVGLGGAGWLALLVLAGWGVAAAAAVVALRTVAGPEAARRAAPVVALLPAAVWAGTSVDGLLAGVVALGVALGVQPGRRAVAAATLALAAALLLSYGAVLPCGIPFAVQLLRRRPRHAALLAAGTVAWLVGVGLATGFWWPDGLLATREAYHAGISAVRPTAYLALAGNPGALAVAAGPVAALAVVAALRRPLAPAHVLTALGFLAVAAADASLLSKGEVERIWLMFVPWLVLAVPARVVATPTAVRATLASQAAVGLAVQAVLRSPW